MASQMNIERMYDRFKEHASSKVANLLDSEVVNQEVARVIMGVSTYDMSENEAHIAIASVFENMASAIPGSFRKVVNSKVPAVVGFVKLNKETRQYDEKKPYLVLASNQLMDEVDSSLWDVKEGETGRYLVRSFEEDLSSLIQTARVMTTSLRNRAPEIASVQPSVSEYAAFLNVGTASIEHGYVVAATDTEATILTETASVVVPINHIIEVAFLNGTDRVEEIAAEYGGDALKGEKQKMEAYYKELYSYAPEYYSEVKKQIDARAFA